MFLGTLARRSGPALLALAAMANASCALAPVEVRESPDFANGNVRAGSLALLPVDLDAVVRESEKVLRHDPELTRELIQALTVALPAALAERGYAVPAVLAQDGSIAGTPHGRRQVVHPRDLQALRWQIHRATTHPRSAWHPEALEGISLDITRQIRIASGSDSSLYARGWVYLTYEDSGKRKALRAAGIVLAVLMVVGIVVLLIASRGKSGSPVKSLGKAAGAVAHAALHAAALVGQVAIRMAPVLIITASTRCFSCGAPHDHIHRPAQRPPPVPAPLPDSLDEPALSPAPPPATPPPSVEAPPPGPLPALPEAPPPGPPPATAPAPPAPAPGAPRPDAPPATGHHDLPHEAGPARAQRMVMHTGPLPPGKSLVGLAMTLVHNHSGRILWHGQQTFELRATGEGDASKLIGPFLDALPLAGQ
jgi:hypothetical protein